jgi:hypothetical protein
MQAFCPSGQTMPHPPQLPGSKAMLVQMPLQNVPPPAHGLHVPELQYGVAPPQTLPQAPQLFGSERRSTQKLPQGASPGAHALQAP